MQVALSLISAFSVDVAVTVISSSSPEGASSGILTVSVAVLLSPTGTESEVGETLGVGVQSALSLASKSYVSSAFPMFVTVTVKVSVSPGTSLWRSGDIETSNTGPNSACATALAEFSTVLSDCEVTVTVMLSSMYGTALSGTVTVSVVVLFPLGPMFSSRLSKSDGAQPALSLTVRT